STFINFTKLGFNLLRRINLVNFILNHHPRYCLVWHCLGLEFYPKILFLFAALYLGWPTAYPAGKFPLCLIFYPLKNHRKQFGNSLALGLKEFLFSDRCRS